MWAWAALHHQATMLITKHPKAVVFNLKHLKTMVLEGSHLKTMVLDGSHLKAMVLEWSHLKTMVAELKLLKAMALEWRQTKAMALEWRHLKAMTKDMRIIKKVDLAMKLLMVPIMTIKAIATRRPKATTVETMSLAMSMKSICKNFVTGEPPMSHHPIKKLAKEVPVPTPTMGMTVANTNLSIPQGKILQMDMHTFQGMVMMMRKRKSLIGATALCNHITVTVNQ